MHQRADCWEEGSSGQISQALQSSRGPGHSPWKNFSRSALTGEGLEKIYSCQSTDPFLVAQPKKRCQSPRTVLLSRDLICITSLKTEKDHALGGAEPTASGEAQIHDVEGRALRELGLSPYTIAHNSVEPASSDPTHVFSYRDRHEPRVRCLFLPVSPPSHEHPSESPTEQQCWPKNLLQ